MQICVLLFDVQFTIVTLLLLKFTSKLIEPYLSQLYIPWCWAFLLAKNLQSLLFTARRSARIAGAVLDTAIPSVCLSVCQSVRRLPHAGIVSKRRHVARCSLHCRIAKCV